MPNSRSFSRALPTPPYYAVIFSSRRAANGEGDVDDGDGGYAAMAERMLALAARVDGFLGVESARDADGFGITVSYWRDEHAIARWKADAEHLTAQTLGREKWYEHYELRVAKVERAYAKPATEPRLPE